MNNITQGSTFANWIPQVSQSANRVSAPQEFLQGNFGGNVAADSNIFTPPFTYTLKRDTLIVPERKRQLRNAAIELYRKNL